MLPKAAAIRMPSAAAGHVISYRRPIVLLAEIFTNEPARWWWGLTALVRRTIRRRGVTRFGQGSLLDARPRLHRRGHYAMDARLVRYDNKFDRARRC